MKIGKNKLKMSSGETRTFGSEKKRDNFERVAQAYNHGWKPKRIGKVKRKSLVKIGFIKSMGGGMAGMTTTSGGAGLIQPQLAGRSVLFRKKKRKKRHNH